MSTFRFKHFTIQQAHAALKVGTDAMLLGSFAHWTNPTRLLDIGTGTGVLALMCAQRFTFQEIVGIEIEANAIHDAQINALNTPFSSKINVIHSSIQSFSPSAQFDAIVSNPPFFENSLKNENEQLGMARHTETLTYSDLILNIKRLLSSKGSAWIILPDASETSIVSLCASNELFIHRMTRIYGKPGKHVRTIYEIGIVNREQTLSDLIIRDEKGNYSEDYKALTREYHDREL